MSQSFSATRQLKTLLFSLAFVFAVAAVILLNWFSSAATVIGTSPEQAIALPQGTSTGILGPGEQRWFSFSPNQTTNKIEDIELNAIFTAGGGASLRNVNFELFSAGEVSAWRQGAKASLTNFGAGMVEVDADGPGLSGRVWRGALISDGLYYLVLRNDTGSPVDYWLFDNTPVAMPSSVPAPAPTEVPVAAPVAAPPAAVANFSPTTAAPLTAPRTGGRLAPGQDIWFSFNVDNSPGEVFEPMALTLIATPNDFGQINSIPLNIYTAAAVASWSPDNRDNFDNVGAGSVAQRDNDPWTGEKVWSGWIVSGDTYYVKIANNHTAPIDYWLFQGDVYNPQLGN